VRFRAFFACDYPTAQLSLNFCTRLPRLQSFVLLFPLYAVAIISAVAVWLDSEALVVPKFRTNLVSLQWWSLSKKAMRAPSLSLFRCGGDGDQMLAMLTTIMVQN